MKGGQPASRALCAAVFFMIGGCAIGGGAGGGTSANFAPATERDQLAEAAQLVEKADWPAPEPAPMLSWITGGGGARVTKSDAVAFYVDRLPENGRFSALIADADAKLADAARFHQTALLTAEAPRVSARDVALVEECIRTLRDHRDIYAAAAHELEDAGDPVDDEAVDQMRRRFGDIVRALGDAADRLAERRDKDRSETFAAPDRTLAGAAPEL